MNALYGFRYSDAELAIFRLNIEEKLAKACLELSALKGSLESLQNSSDNRSFCDPDDYQDVSEKEWILTMMERQRRFIQNLQNAKIRIENKTYGICIISGELIPRERLFVVPHATKTVMAKMGVTRKEVGESEAESLTE